MTRALYYRHCHDWVPILRKYHRYCLSIVILACSDLTDTHFEINKAYYTDLLTTSQCLKNMLFSYRIRIMSRKYIVAFECLYRVYIPLHGSKFHLDARYDFQNKITAQKFLYYSVNLSFPEKSRHTYLLYKCESPNLSGSIAIHMLLRRYSYQSFTTIIRTITISPFS